MSSAEKRKRDVGRRAAELVRDGTVIGLGTGSTANHFVDRLGELVREGLRVRGVPTSDRTAARAAALGIELVTLEEHPRLDLAVDGADQVDPGGDLIKGLGGALYREKLVARAADVFVVIVDASKAVPRLGEGCPVPVEVRPGEWRSAADGLRAIGAEPTLRRRGGQPYVTDNGNRIVDSAFGPIPDAAALERRINELPGVVENGLFPGMTHRILVGDDDGVREWTPARPPAMPASGRGGRGPDEAS
jgi:ribose 5-phosphate isomerase A